MANFKVVLVVLTLNAAGVAEAFLRSLQMQTFKINSLLVLDSCSKDSTRSIFARNGAEVLLVDKGTFDHGSTRQFAASRSSADADLIVFMTQDSVLADQTSLACLIESFEDPRVGAAYGRQLPREDANPIEAHARIFNYPPESRVNRLADRKQRGIKTCFMSNSFAAYRCSSLLQVGGFPEHNIVSEETYVAAKMLEAGWHVRYCAEATVYHSHNYSIWQEVQRYFDLGVFHSREPWVRNCFGLAESEGRRFVLSQLSFLMERNINLVPSALIRTVFKYLGFRLGLCEVYLPNRLKSWLSMQKHYWIK